MRTSMIMHAGPQSAGQATPYAGQATSYRAPVTPHEAGSGARQPDGRRADTGQPGARRPGWWRRAWQRLMPPPSAELILAQLNRQLAVLEKARTELEAGWVQGGWWTVSSGNGSPRLVTSYPALSGNPGQAGGNPGQVDGACLVGALMRAGSHLPDAASAVGRAVDAVYDALWASRGQPSAPRPCGVPPVPAPDVRLARVRTLTQWNDQAGRTKPEVLAMVDQAISATIMDLMSAPRPAQAQPAAALSAARTG